MLENTLTETLERKSCGEIIRFLKRNVIKCLAFRFKSMKGK